MTSARTLRLTSLLCALLFSVHWIQDVALGIDSVGLQSLGGVAILLAWSYAALQLAERRAGQILMLLAGFFSAGVTALHLNGSRIGAIATGDGGFAFLWTLVALGTTGALSFVLAVQALLRRSSSPESARAPTALPDRPADSPGNPR